MLRREDKVGDYFKLQTCTFTGGEYNGARKTLVLLIEELHAHKKYRQLTLFYAVNIADRYLHKLAESGQTMPKVIHLAAVSLLLAAKMNEPISPNFKNMVFLIEHMQPGALTLHDLIQLERQIILLLDFNLQSECSINFLERYCQLFMLDDGLFPSTSPNPTPESSFNHDVCQ